MTIYEVVEFGFFFLEQIYYSLERRGNISHLDFFTALPFISIENT